MQSIHGLWGEMRGDDGLRAARLGP